MANREQNPSYDELASIVRAIVPRCVCEKPARFKVLYRKSYSWSASGQNVPAQSSLSVCSRECFDDVRMQLHKGSLGSWDGKPAEIVALNELTIRLTCIVEAIEKNLDGQQKDKNMDDASIRFSLLELD